MDQIAKSIEKTFELELSEIQFQEIDSLYQSFVSELVFPLFPSNSDFIIKMGYFRRFLNVLNPKQHKTFKNKRFALKLNDKKEEIAKKEKYLALLEQKYEDLKLTTEQLELIYNIDNPIKGYSSDLEDIQARIRTALEPTINKHQKEELEKKFSTQLKEYRLRKAELTKSKYSYLELSIQQAKEISLIDEREEKSQKENQYKGNDPFLIKPDFKEILTTKQFERYKANQEKQKKHALQSQIKNDADSSNQYIELGNWVNFLTHSILPAKCKIAKQVLTSTSKEDMLRIEQIKSEYQKAIEDRILNQKIEHEKKYGSQLPNRLRLEIIEMTLLYIDPSPKIVSYLDLNKNEFPSVRLTDTQQSELEKLRIHEREYKIKLLEEKVGGVYASLAFTREKVEISKFVELYSLLMIETDFQKNIDNLKMRLSEHGITL